MSSAPGDHGAGWPENGTVRSGPLADLKVVEIGSLGPGPFAAMLLADLGAEVVRLDRASEVGAYVPAEDPAFTMRRGRPSLAVDLKHPDGAGLVRRLVAGADILVEGFRPGVMERLGVGPEELSAVNPRLVYGRMTGYGQTGPWAGVAGHDINYAAMAGPLFHTGDADRPPQPPLNLLGDFGGGGMLLAFGLVSAVLEARRSGRGQVVDAAMVDGTALLATMFFGHAAPELERGRPALAGGRHWYSTYETSDGGFMAVGAAEPQFYARFVELLGLDPQELPQHVSAQEQPAIRSRVAEVFRSRTRDEWAAVFDGTDACVTPVLSIEEAARHRHQVDREAFVEIGGVRQPAPAPRFSRTAPGVPTPPSVPGEHSDAVLARFGLAPRQIEEMRQSGLIG